MQRSSILRRLVAAFGISVAAASPALSQNPNNPSAVLTPSGYSRNLASVIDSFPKRVVDEMLKAKSEPLIARDSLERLRAEADSLPLLVGSAEQVIRVRLITRLGLAFIEPFVPLHRSLILFDQTSNNGLASRHDAAQRVLANFIEVFETCEDVGRITEARSADPVMQISRQLADTSVRIALATTDPQKLITDLATESRAVCKVVVRKLIVSYSVRVDRVRTELIKDVAQSRDGLNPSILSTHKAVTDSLQGQVIKAMAYRP